MKYKPQKLLEFYLTTLEQNNEKLNEIINENEEKLDDFLPLIDFILDRVDTVCLLIEENRTWDAEIIFRSVIESFIKFIYLSSAPEDEKEKRLNEYANDLGEIKQFRYSNLLKQIFPIMEPSVVSEGYSSIILPKNEEHKLKEKWTYESRQNLEKKWTFSNLLRSVIKDYHGVKFELLKILFNNYMLSSSVAHADIMGLYLIDEFNVIEETAKIDIAQAQKIRIISDCSIYCFLVAIEIAIYLEIDATFFMEIFNKAMSVRDETLEYVKLVFDKVNTAQPAE